MDEPKAPLVRLLVAKLRGRTRSYFFSSEEDFVRAKELAQRVCSISGEGKLHLPYDRSVITYEEFKEIMKS